MRMPAFQAHMGMDTEEWMVEEMRLSDLLLVASDNQQTRVYLAGEGITGTADALYTYLAHEALEGVVGEMSAENGELTIWVDYPEKREKGE